MQAAAVRDGCLRCLWWVNKESGELLVSSVMKDLTTNIITDIQNGQ